MADQSLSVTFSNSCEAALACSVEIERDELLNGGSTSFKVGEFIFYKVLPSASYACYTTHGGTLSIHGSKVTASKTETLTFAGVDSVNLSYPLEAGFSYNWLGSALAVNSGYAKCTPNVLAINGRKSISVPEPVYGILQVTYDYSYTSVKFVPLHTGKQLVVLSRLCDTGEEACAYQFEEIGTEALEEVTLTIVDACDNSVKVPGAQVTVDGTLIETVTDANGQISLGSLAKGTHTIRVTAPGYTPSDEDTLDNSSIIVE